jgi:hypothetical protein
MRSGKWLIATALAAVAYGHAQATVVDQLLPSTHGWRVFYDDAEILGFTYTPIAENRGNLSFSTRFTTTQFSHPLFSPGLSFIQDNPPPASGSFGLRLFMNDKVLNQTGVALSGLQLGLVEVSTENGAGHGVPGHPGSAHFHAGASNGAGAGCSDAQLFGPFSGGGSSNVFDPLCNSGTDGSIISLSAGTIPNGGSATFSEFGLHEFEIANTIRVFSFYELPLATSVPEPATIGLFGVGVLGLAAGRLRDRRPRSVA